MEQKEGQNLSPIIGEILDWYDFWIKHYQDEEKLRGKSSGIDIPYAALKQTMLHKDEAGWKEPNDLTNDEYDELAKILHEKNPTALTDWNQYCQEALFQDEREDRLRESVNKLLQNLPQPANEPG